MMPLKVHSFDAPWLYSWICENLPDNCGKIIENLTVKMEISDHSGLNFSVEKLDTPHFWHVAMHIKSILHNFINHLHC